MVVSFPLLAFNIPTEVKSWTFLSENLVENDDCMQVNIEYSKEERVETRHQNCIIRQNLPLNFFFVLLIFKKSRPPPRPMDLMANQMSS